MTGPTLIRGDYEASLAPGLGGVLLSFTYRGEDILRPAASIDAVENDPREAACFPCVPYFGRLHDGLSFAGEHFDLAPTLPVCDAKYALHGDGWVSPWTIANETSASATFRYVHHSAAPRYPFPYEAEQNIRLGDDGLAIILSVRNIGPRKMPAGLGLHPFFPRTAKAQLQFVAKELWTPAQEGGGLRGPIPLKFNFAAGAPLPSEMLNHTFAGFEGAVTVTQNKTRISITTDAPLLHVYAPAGENFFCLEPVTHFPGDFGWRTLTPGEALTLSMTIAVAG